MSGGRGLGLWLLRGTLGDGVKAAEAVRNTAVAPLGEVGNPGQCLCDVGKLFGQVW